MKTALRHVRTYAALGKGPADHIRLAIFGFIATRNLTSPNSKWNSLFSSLSRFWVRPQQLLGLKLSIDATDRSQVVIFDEIFLKSSYDLAKVPFLPGLVIDCGAHIGMFSLLAKATYPAADLIAYEPNPANALFVRRQFSRNSLAATFHQCAVSTREGQVSFAAVNSHGGRIAGIESDGLDLAGSATFAVKTVDFREVLTAAKPSSLLLKMDIEGEERAVLPAVVSLLPQQTALFFETHAGEMGWNEIKELLSLHGFRIEKINSRGQYCDGFACRL